MPERTAEEAQEAFILPIRQSLSVVIPRVHLHCRPARPQHYPDGLISLTLSAPGSVMQLHGSNLRLYFNHIFKIVRSDRGAYKVSSEGYAYRVDRPAEDQTPEEVISYHWHPYVPGGPTFPHLHVHVSKSDQHIARVHFPTGRMSIERLILFLIRDYGVVPTTEHGESIVGANLQRLESSWRWF